MSNYIGKTTTITVKGKKYVLSRLDRGVLKEFADWYWAQQPDPLEIAAAHVKSFPPDLQKILLQTAWDESKKRKDMDSPEVKEAQSTLAGGCKMLQLLMAKQQPDMSEDECFDIAMDYFDELVESQKLHLVKLGLSEVDAQQQALKEALSGVIFQKPSDDSGRPEADNAGGRPEGHVLLEGVDHSADADGNGLDGSGSPALRKVSSDAASD